MERLCAPCGKPFPAKRSSQKFCSVDCSAKAHGESLLGTGVAKKKCTCKGCGTAFETYHKNRKYCTFKCYVDCGACAEQALKAAALGGSGGKDANQDEIVKGLRAAGATVIITTHIGHGFPDLLCGWNGRNVLLEIKNPATAYGRRGAKLNQLTWAEQWEGEKPVVVFSLEQAAAAVFGK
jgi:hypothetical protein